MSEAAVANLDLGRTARLVDSSAEGVSAKQTPHPRVRRGEFGERMRNYNANSEPVDPLARVVGTRNEDTKNLYRNVAGKAPINPVRSEPVARNQHALTRHLKRVAKALGASDFAVARSHFALFYEPSDEDPDPDGAVGDPQRSLRTTRHELAERYPYLVVLPVELNHDLIQAHRSVIGDIAYGLCDCEMVPMQLQLQRYIRDLGYEAEVGLAIPQAAALAGGLGELGRNGMVITRKFGARILLGSVIATNMPLRPGKPVDLAVEDFCSICNKCAVTCPTNSISFGDKKVIRGVEKHAINWETCYRLRPHVRELWRTCLTCITVCPYSKPDSYWRSAAMWLLRLTPIRFRGGVVRLLKRVDDSVWGVEQNRRVRWAGYDSAVQTGGCCTDKGADTSTGPLIQISSLRDGAQAKYAPVRSRATDLKSAAVRDRPPVDR